MNEMIIVFLMLASIIQFKFGNRNAKQNLSNKSGLHSFNQTFSFGHNHSPNNYSPMGSMWSARLVLLLSSRFFLEKMTTDLKLARFKKYF